MKARAAASVLVTLLCSASAAAQVTERWVARYHGPVPGSGDGARAIAIDSITGNIYVTGQSLGVGTGLDYATVAYDSSGHQLWEARYNGPGNGDDRPSGLAIDSITGNIYVTGQSLGIGTGVDYATVAYDSSGHQLWEARYDGPASGTDIANGIGVDSVTGNVYVTGQSQGIGTGYDYATVAYDSSGSQLWAATYNGADNKDDFALAITVDSAGKVYVTGHITVGLVTKPATVAYDPAGSQLWASVYQGYCHDICPARAIAVDSSSGNVYVTGSLSTLGGGGLGTIAWDQTGTQLWARIQNSGDSDSGAAIALGGTGNVYVTGSTRNGGLLRYETIAYDPNGNQLWLARDFAGPGSSFATAIAVDLTTEHVYVTGRGAFPSSPTSLYAYATAAYDSSGNQLWAISYHGPTNGVDVANAIAIDNIGTVYVTGVSQAAGGGSDFATVAYSQP